ncbi:MAG: alcohol dehydrogenase catalytic domain-containing protein [Eubacteriales bacterium]
MKAAVVTGNCTLEIMEIQEPNVIKDTQIKVFVKKAAICNTTDNKVYATDTPEKDWPNASFPYIIGHECSGVIVDKGAAVTDMNIGDRVVYWTVNGKAFADYVILDTASSVVGVINESVPEDVAAIMEMVIGASRLLFAADGTPLINKGDKVAIYGLGPAGLIYHRIAIMMGASKVCGVGRRKLRLDKSLEVGADFVADTESEGYIERILEGLDGSPDAIIDATGGDIIQDIIALSSPKTQIFAYGIAPFDWEDKRAELEAANVNMPIPMGADSAKESIKKCIEWVESGKFGLEPIISHRIPFSDIAKGLDMCRVERDTTLKVVISVND